ncbi:GNAT family N-acetyltransferase [Phaeobacter porticola]|uniref:Putative acetyltransferase, GNAT family n=1 Tax=Phaeobacter porticola TaxID=1844006 RepID=A0A1L3I7A8_9RHOB|nr:GNAT family N-acetyltransferase [Phaeobacter porticola]APG47927.1 putative acetyltransferase, GNAT family [Phaeobacter porticola]
MTLGFVISRASATEPEAAALIKRHLEQMASQSPEESCHALDGGGLDGDDVAFFLLRQEGTAIAMGALKQLRDGARELKSMHTLSEARGSGAGRMMLEFLLSYATEHGATAICLETGSTSDFEPARKLYEHYGFVECPPFEGYAKDPWSIFMRLDLSAAA